MGSPSLETIGTLLIILIGPGVKMHSIAKQRIYDQKPPSESARWKDRAVEKGFGAQIGQVENQKEEKNAT